MNGGGWEEIALRFVLGGLIVSAFAVLGDLFEPKTFAGLFGAAPSVALATLALTLHTHDASFVLTESRSMLLGAVAFVAYSTASAIVIRSHTMPVWLGAALSWIVWLAVGFGLWSLSFIV